MQFAKENRLGAKDWVYVGYIDKRGQKGTAFECGPNFVKIWWFVFKATNAVLSNESLISGLKKRCAA